jgi:ParB-like chromosome segregation protein Spo0J
MSMTKHEGREVTLHINDLVMDPKFQMRNDLNDQVISRYVTVLKSEKEMPPIKVALIDKMYLLLDGWHRVEATKELGQHKIKAIVLEVSRTEALWIAASANLEHGLQLKGMELKNVFKAYIRAKQHVLPNGHYKSYRQIGREIGKTHHTVISWMKELYPKIAGAMMDEDVSYKDFDLPEPEPSNFSD